MLVGVGGEICTWLFLFFGFVVRGGVTRRFSSCLAHGLGYEKGLAGQFCRAASALGGGSLFSMLYIFLAGSNF